MLIPVDPHVTPGSNGVLGDGDDITQDAGVFTMWGGALSGIPSYSYTGSVAGDSSTAILVTFTATSSTTVLAFGAHVASEADWGPGNGAFSISGSPYHVSTTNAGSLTGGGEAQILSECADQPAQSAG